MDGDGPLATLRGGYNVARGRQSVIDIHPIMALSGSPKVKLFEVIPALTKAKLFRRDPMTCACCGQWCYERDLSCEHIVPQARGGRWTWMNLVTACGPCNGRKADRTPEGAGMPLLYLPYVPSRFEDFLLEGRCVRADVHGWLAARLPKYSRLSMESPVAWNRRIAHSVVCPMSKQWGGEFHWPCRYQPRLRRIWSSGSNPLRAIKLSARHIAIEVSSVHRLDGSSYAPPPAMSVTGSKVSRSRNHVAAPTASPQASPSRTPTSRTSSRERYRAPRSTGSGARAIRLIATSAAAS